MSKDPNQESENEGVLVTKPRVAVKQPRTYKVLLHNDDYTPMDFVVEVLEAIFNKDNTSAVKIMLDVHNKGVGVCGHYPFDIASTKVSQVQESSEKNQYPLKCTMEHD